MLNKLNNDQIEKLLSSQLVGRLGIHADDLTYVVPVSYAYDGHYLYGRTFEGMKLDMLRKNPKVCFQADDTHDLSNWQSVICWGEFEELTSADERSHAIHILAHRNLPLLHSETMDLTADSPFAPESNKVEGVLFRVKLNKKTGMLEASSQPYYYAT